MKLKIKESSWSGWSRNYKPQEIEKEYDLKLNEKYVINTTIISYVKDGEIVKEEQEIFSFNIIEINENNIKIVTYQPFSDNEGGIINLKSNKKDFIISVGKSLKLITPTMDYGRIFILTLIK